MKEARKIPTRITMKWLTENRACEAGKRLFLQMAKGRKSIPVTLENLKALENSNDCCWVGQKLLGEEREARIYRETHSPEEYVEKLWRAIQRTIQSQRARKARSK